MKLQTIRLCNFQSFGATTTEIALDDVTYLIGPNGSGKTAALLALCRAFSIDPAMRRVQRSDFHAPTDEENAPDERELWIELDFRFPELLGEDAASTVAPHFGHMRLDAADSIPRVRFRLTATLGADGDIEESLVYVLDVDAEGTPLSTAVVPRAERSQIQVHYLPARRDPADHITYGANALLGRLLRAVNWEDEREEIKDSMEINTPQGPLRLSAHHCPASPGRTGREPQDGAAADERPRSEVSGSTQEVPLLPGRARLGAQSARSPVRCSPTE